MNNSNLMISPGKPNGEADNYISVKEFFEEIPPGKQEFVKDVALYKGGAGLPHLSRPDLQLFCETETCSGIMFFEPLGGDTRLFETSLNRLFVNYQCRNCNKTEKTFAISVALAPTGKLGTKDGHLYKYGEVPAFGPPIPKKVFSILGPDIDSFSKGRRSENQGLGIGAFGYYRRVVENQKNRLFDEIIKALKQLGGSEDLINDLEAAKEETQFTKAIESIKHGIPDLLKVKGHNPLTLLHNALSQGLHELSEEECLEIAGDIRTILYELGERLSQALKDDKELGGAVSRLMQLKSQKIQNPKETN